MPLPCTKCFRIVVHPDPIPVGNWQCLTLVGPTASATCGAGNMSGIGEITGPIDYTGETDYVQFVGTVVSAAGGPLSIGFNFNFSGWISDSCWLYATCIQTGDLQYACINCQSPDLGGHYDVSGTANLNLALAPGANLVTVYIVMQPGPDTGPNEGHVFGASWSA